MTDHKGVGASPRAPTPASHNSSYVRLHVSPLDAELLKVALSSAVLPKARNISYHALEAFPEKRYGFLELPSEDAEKLKNKLNGSVLRGVKIRIEPARPSRLPPPLAQAAMAEEKLPRDTADGILPPKDKKDKKKKRKRDGEELSGLVLEDGRKIKRGWTSADEPKEKRSKKDKDKKGKKEKKKTKSKYTDHAECLVKTVLPANAAPLTDADHSTPTKKKKKGRSREVVIHEFEKTTKFPTFLKAAAPASQSSVPLEFVEGKGWVNEDGDVVETVNTRPPPSARVLLSGKSKDHGQETVPDEESTADSSDDESRGNCEPESPVSAEGSERVLEPTGPDASSPSSPAKHDHPRPRSSGSLSIKIPPATPNEPKVHPLEALYKRPQQLDGETPKAAPDGQGFSFFAGANDESAEEDGNVDAGEPSGVHVPLTPFTRHDLELRGVRSAAPTPDTAHPSRGFTPWEGDNDDGEQDDGDVAYEESEDDDEQSASNGATTLGGEGDGKPASDFQKWFWENRGDLNRSWKKRRKVAGKEKRYRENKARMGRAI
ncbi:hypothetical protein C8A01DRAFT_16505 [Parachaetomium inaequale]|uniref:RRM domain-containing protein n=1 Tax=Parachaetomium inaequale TaxID=2588326 RepID=A0AAN6SRM8_9PEZI|nr:hypothetical protein C8A01DRAFT_16505 [Parachaetomium inaequale]